MSKNKEALLAVRSTKWTEAEEAKLRQALLEHPIILDWLVDAQADNLEDFSTKPVDFQEDPNAVAATNAYSKGRLAQTMELIGTAQILLKQPAGD